MHRLKPLVAFTGAALASAAGWAAVPGKLEFNRDIRPILSENCLQCHGQDAQRREAKLRLDDRASATRENDGVAAIRPGRPEESEMIFRILSSDTEEVMPPPSTHKRVSAAQAAQLRRWIAEGADYQEHWAFVTPTRAALPSVSKAEWPRQGIDHFVLQGIERAELAPSPAAAPATWLRRASLDLTGLPPTPAELDRFTAEAAQSGEDAYLRATDRLLASPHFGERLALDWLDTARYADTHGFNNDSSRTMWRWRDWVIESFNANRPYDRFIMEQIAGDLLPAATLEQRIATGFNRNHVISSEGGIIEEEYRVEYVADRVKTVSTAWLGLTFECARCHDHKFDPISQRDYYRLFAFFNNVPEHGEDGRVANAVPMLPSPTREQQAELARQNHAIAALEAAKRAAQSAWQWRDADRDRSAVLTKEARTALDAEKDATVVEISRPPSAAGPTPVKAAKTATATLVRATDDAAAAISSEGAAAVTPPVAKKISATKLDFNRKEGVTIALWIQPETTNPRDVAIFSNVDYTGSPAATTFGRGAEWRLIDGELEVRLCNRYPAYAVIARTKGARLGASEWHHLAVSYAGNRKAADLRFYIDGQEIAAETRYDDLHGDLPKTDFLVGTDTALPAARWLGKIEDLRVFPRVIASSVVRAAYLVRALPEALAGIGQPNTPATHRHALRDALLADDAATRDIFKQHTTLLEEHLALRRSLPTTMVMEELPQPRPAFILKRGQYDAPGEPVDAGVPEALLGTWPQAAPRNRLGLAQWLTRPDHPLTARVVVNRFWTHLFGTGLVKTLEDFGSQGEWPSHPELLDWLAREFVDRGWNVKALFKQIVLSATYRQDSAVTTALLKRDPENRLLARGPRVRLPAELIRDQALAVSGLLTPRVGGPSVYPYQPEKLYEGIVVGAAYPGTQWGKGTESDLYRRSLYTFWKRTVPHPAMSTFDAPDREFCTVRRSRTNTPLQALTLWNEPGYVEAARRLATRMLRDFPGSDAARIALAFQAATGRHPRPTETAVLLRTFASLRTDYAAHPQDAAALLRVGLNAVDPSIPPADLAAATGVASMILNLDETITKN